MSFTVNIKKTPLTEQQITENHKHRGYVLRYFAAKANHIDEQVFEVTRRDYEFLKTNQYIITGTLSWIIKGPLEDREFLIYTGNPTFEGSREPINIPGVLTQNESAVRFLSKKIPAVKNYLTDYKQFYVGV